MEMSALKYQIAYKDAKYISVTLNYLGGGMVIKFYVQAKMS